MKHVFSKKPRPDPELLTLQAELEDARNDLALAYRQFNQAVDPELVESCVYQISAVKARCNYLIRSIKERTPGMPADAPTKARRNSVRAPRQGAESACPAAAPQRCDPCEEEGGAVWT